MMEPESEFILVHDKQRKCLYLTLASIFKNSEGLDVIEKFPNAARAIQMLQKYSKQKVFGKMNLKDAVSGLNSNNPNDGIYGKSLTKEDDEYDDEPENYYSSAKGQMIDRVRAEKELKNHGHDRGTSEWREFERVFGPKFKKNGKIAAQELLGWLGY